MADKITLKTKIKDLDASIRVKNCMINEAWVRDYANKNPTIGDLADLPEYELMRIPNFGRKSLREWNNIVAKARGMTLDEEEKSAEQIALKEMRTMLNQIAGAHRHIASLYNKLGTIIFPVEAK